MISVYIDTVLVTVGDDIKLSNGTKTTVNQITETDDGIMLVLDNDLTIPAHVSELAEI